MGIRTKRLVAVAVLMFAAMTATAIAGAEVGPVSPKVLFVVNAHGKLRAGLEEAVRIAPRGAVRLGP